MILHLLYIIELLTATAVGFRHFLTEELLKKHLGQHPVVAVDAILHLGDFYCSLYQSGIFQFGKML